MTLASGGGESDLPTCGPPDSYSVHLASSAVTPAGSVHKFMSAYAVEEMMSVMRVGYIEGIVVMDVI